MSVHVWALRCSRDIEHSLSGAEFGADNAGGGSDRDGKRDCRATYQDNVSQRSGARLSGVGEPWCRDYVTLFAAVQVPCELAPIRASDVGAES